ncbi:FUSC family protein [Dechloromonas denitrificans]|uniref:FUSC family protein n=1 Tax=Dechloromonas denitrificans TaxID=281362 RepID=UPI001CF918A4|nr:FUSC family protein [Dechloromonas denitrificans]UCV02077.1 FUSC family protein [Dechloromonas denitrificans]
MTRSHRWLRLKILIRAELLHLTTINASDRRWQMPFAAALASGLPLLVGAYFEHMDYGLISSLGGLVFLYLPETPLHHRMVSLMVCAFAMIASYALGVMSHLFPPAMMLVLTFTAILVTMVCRFYNLGPPGSFFFIMAAAIGANAPGDVLQIPLKVGLLTMGCLLACLIAFFYSVYMLRSQPAKPVTPLPPPTFDFVVFDSIVIGSFVGISLALAQALQLTQAYWVTISCLAVIQGMSLRAVWNKQLQRLIGTGVGLLLSWGLLMLPLDNWRISLVMIALAFVIEMLVVRHYALAAIFITPMTILLVEATTLVQSSPSALIEARFLDTILGCLVGLVGGICLHSPRFRQLVGRQIRRLAPARQAD